MEKQKYVPIVLNYLKERIEEAKPGDFGELKDILRSLIDYVAGMQIDISEQMEYLSGHIQAILLAMDKTDVSRQFDDAMCGLTTEDGDWIFNQPGWKPDQESE